MIRELSAYNLLVLQSERLPTFLKRWGHKQDGGKSERIMDVNQRESLPACSEDLQENGAQQWKPYVH